MVDIKARKLKPFKIKGFESYTKVYTLSGGNLYVFDLYLDYGNKVLTINIRAKDLQTAKKELVKRDFDKLLGKW